MKMLKLAGIGMLCASAGLTTAPALAQAEEAESARSNAIMETITTTSRKRAVAEIAQDVPLSSTPFSAAKIDAIAAVDMIDMGRLVPGARFENHGNSPGYALFFVRGAGMGASVPSFDPAVGIFVDGVFMGQQSQSVIDTFDLEAVEILRGPQGTLFGRNVTGGAVVARTRRPTDELNIRGKVGYGSGDRLDLAFSISGPVVEGKMNAKLAAQYRDTGDYVYDNATDRKVGGAETIIVRPAIAFTPSDNFEFTIMGEYFHLGGDPQPTVSLSSVGLGTTGGLNHPDGRGFYETWHDNATPVPHFVDNTRWRISGEMIWELDHGVITAITGYADLNHAFGGDFDGSPLAYIFSTQTYLDQNQFSQEVRYASSFSEVFDFTVGFYYFTQDVYYGEQRYQGGLVGALPGHPGNEIGAGIPLVAGTDHDQWSVFLQGNVNISDRFVLTLGGRYTEEKKATYVHIVNFGNCVSAGTFNTNPRDFSCSGGPDIDDSHTWKSFTPKIGVEFNLTDDAILYASWTRGNRSGGFNYRVSDGELSLSRPAFFDDERVDAYEIGLKSDWFDNRLRVNMAAYYNDFTDIQRSIFLTQTDEFGNVIGLTQQFSNVKAAATYGFELEVVGVLAEDAFTDGDSLTTEFSLGLIESKYKVDYIDFNGDGENDVGLPFEQQPSHTIYAALTYLHPVGNAGALTWRISYVHTPAFYSGGENLWDINRHVSRGLLDASIRYEGADGDWHVMIYGKNLTNERYYQTRTPFAPAFGLAQPARGAAWGAEVGFDF